MISGRALGNWFFMRLPQRTITPDSKITVGEIERFRETTEAKPTEDNGIIYLNWNPMYREWPP